MRNLDPKCLYTVRVVPGNILPLTTIGKLEAIAAIINLGWETLPWYKKLLTNKRKWVLKQFSLGDL